MATDPTAAPKDFTPATRAMYYKLRKILRDEFKTWHDGDAELLTQTCRWAQRAADARAGLKDAQGNPALTANGYKGQPVMHPNLRAAMEAEKAFVDGLKELGFSPTARARLGLDAKRAGPSKFGLG